MNSDVGLCTAVTECWMICCGNVRWKIVIAVGKMRESGNAFWETRNAACRRKENISQSVYALTVL
jgi:hypothetical protein